MPVETESPVPTQTENPTHYSYLKEFRVEQCPLFLQHKCQQHRPYTCFHWHFMNQRRRRPLRKRDGTFNYSPDVYCSKYEEASGICPDGDDCPYLHRTAGDTERRYHLRYYKTAYCVYETDTKGHCVKNGPHCAFAHGPSDVRSPVHDVREIKAMETNGEEKNEYYIDPITGGTPSSIEKERNMISEDHQWSEPSYILLYYKTEPCKRPPRLCRQGYACPSYHNARDRRRPPKLSRYRSTPCPNVKQGDEWGEPSGCEKGDQCSYCHTRTEQQFHPEIYKSNKCNDMQQSGYCPRGPFCAFAHVDNERQLCKGKELMMEINGTSLANFMPSTALGKDDDGSGGGGSSTSLDSGALSHAAVSRTVSALDSVNLYSSYGEARTMSDASCKQVCDVHVGRPARSYSLPSSASQPSLAQRVATRHLLRSGGNNNKPLSPVIDNVPSNLSRAPGQERHDYIDTIRQKILAVENDPSLDLISKSDKVCELKGMLHSLENPGSSFGDVSEVGSGTCSPSLWGQYPASTRQEPAQVAGGAGQPGPAWTSWPHPRSSNTSGSSTRDSAVESLFEQGSDDFGIGDHSKLTSLDKDIDGENSLANSLGSSFGSIDKFSSSAPVNIPHTQRHHSISGDFHYPTAYSTHSPLSGISYGTGASSRHRFHSQIGGGNMAGPNLPSNAGPGGLLAQVTSSRYGSLPNGNGVLCLPASPTPFTPNSDDVFRSSSSGGSNSISNAFHIQQQQQQPVNTSTLLQQYEENMMQLKNACSAWKREYEDLKRKLDMTEQRLIETVREKEEMVRMVSSYEQEHSVPTAQMMLQYLSKDVEKTDEGKPVTGEQLSELLKRAHVALQHVDKLNQDYSSNAGVKCLVCSERDRDVKFLPCQHVSTCQHCATNTSVCLLCWKVATHKEIKNTGGGV